MTPGTAWEERAQRVARLTPSALTRLYNESDGETRRSLLRARFRYKPAEFLAYCLPSLFSRPFNRFHRAMLDREKRPHRERVGQNAFRAAAAPRGIAKTTVAKGDIVHDIVYGLESYIVIVSAETRLARKITGHLRRLFLATTGALAELYGPFALTGGVDEFTVTAPGSAPIGVLARSFGTQVRGANEDGMRPTRILVDDGERPDRVRNPDLRRQHQEFLDQDIIRAGPIDGGLNLDFNGTILHPDSVLANAIKNPAWSASVWKACEVMPDRLDLWEQCGRIWADLALGDVNQRRACALEFYGRHRADMDRGARMLDARALPLFAFFEAAWSQGWASVLKELQNEPRAAGSTFYDSSTFARCVVHADHLVTAEGRRVRLSDCRAFLRLDPIPGDELGGLASEDHGAGGSDFAAIAAILRDPFGYGFVVEAWMRRARDSVQLAALWELSAKWAKLTGQPSVKATIESNGFQRLLGREFRRQQVQRRDRGEFWQVTAEDDTSTTNKEDRLASLEGPVAAGWLQFASHLPPALLAQFDAFPGADHDDGHDAVEGAWRNSSVTRVGMVNTPLGFNFGPRP